MMITKASVWRVLLWMSLCWQGAPAAAQEARAETGAADAPAPYVVQRGDSLWKISETHLDSGRAWPALWSLNLQIPNPRRIYPGQVLALTRPGAAEEMTRLSPVARVEELAPVPYQAGAQPRRLVPRGSFLERDLILSPAQSAIAARIVTLEQGRMYADAGTRAWVAGGAPPAASFHLYRLGRTVLDAAGKLAIGQEAHLLGSAHMVGTGAGGKFEILIDAATQEIGAGDVLVKRGEPLAGAQRQPTTGTPGRILRLYDAAGRDAVAGGLAEAPCRGTQPACAVLIDRGAADGVAVGQAFGCTAGGANAAAAACEIVVVRVFERCAYGMVRHGADAMAPGNGVYAMGMTNLVRQKD